jgi:hypothetical protein
MAKAKWYCHECETHGGGKPNNLTMQEHIDYAHDKSIVRMEKV